MAAGLQPDRAVIVEPEPDGVSALGEIEGFGRMTGCGRQRLSGFRRSCEACSRLLARVGERERGLTEALRISHTGSLPQCGCHAIPGIRQSAATVRRRDSHRTCLRHISGSRTP